MAVRTKNLLGGLALFSVLVSGCTSAERGAPAPDDNASSPAAAASCGQESELGAGVTLDPGDVWKGGTGGKSERSLALRAEQCGARSSAAVKDCASFPWIGEGRNDASDLYRLGAGSWTSTTLERSDPGVRLRSQIVTFSPQSGFDEFMLSSFQRCRTHVDVEVNGRPQTVHLVAGGVTRVVVLNQDRLVYLDTDDPSLQSGGLLAVADIAERKAAGLRPPA